jgi:hypothetical protein
MSFFKDSRISYIGKGFDIWVSNKVYLFSKQLESHDIRWTVDKIWEECYFSYVEQIKQWEI